jgi:hypothetical protein
MYWSDNWSVMITNPGEFSECHDFDISISVLARKATSADPNQMAQMCWAQDHKTQSGDQTQISSI